MNNIVTYLCFLGDLAQFVSKLTLCSIEAGMCDDKERVLSLIGTTVSL